MNNLIMIGDVSNICTEASELLQLVGWVLTIVKIIIPLIIIGLGLIDLGKAAISSKPEEVKKCATSLMWRVVGGVAIFFIPTIILVAFGFVNKFGQATSQVDFDVCKKCLITPWSDECKTAVSKSTGFSE